MKPSKVIISMMCAVVVCAFAAFGDERTQQLDQARAYIEVGRYYEAKKLASSLLDANPSDAEAAAVRDRADEQLRITNQQRVAAAEAAVKRDNVTDADRLELAEAYFAAARYEDAADLYAKLPLATMTYETRLNHARALSWSSHLYPAEERYAALATERPSPELDLEYGRLLSWMGAGKAARARLQRAYDATHSEEAAIALANARAWSGDREGAAQFLSDFTAANANAPEAQRLLAELRSSPDIEIERIDRLIAADPYNLALHGQRARVLYDGGRYGAAIHEVEFIREHSSVPAELAQLETNAKARQREEIAKLDERRRALTAADSPMYSAAANSSAAQNEEILSLAKAYTGLSAYRQAADLYDSYLDRVPNDSRARLNYARVLSWDQRYPEARRQYEIILRNEPDRADVRLEYAQALSYDREYVPAVRTFRTLTDMSTTPRAYLYDDVPERAHFNLGQIYRWYGWRDHAVREQNAALAMNSQFADAQMELHRARYGMPGSQLEARYTEETNSNDFHVQRGDLEGEHWLNTRTAVQVGIGRHNFDQGGLTADANVASVGAAYRQNDHWTFRARAGATFWDGGLGTRPFLGLGAVYLPNIQSRAAFDYNHYDLIYDASSIFTVAPRAPQPRLNDPLSVDDFRAHYDWDSGGFLSALGEASYGLISDDNRRAAAHGLVSFRVLKSPFVALKADGRVLSYDFRSNRYWSPDDYTSLAGVIQAGQDFRQKFYWMVEFKAGKSWEGDHESDLRAWGGRVTVPIGDTFDVIGAYNYGRSGRFESLTGDPEFTNYWQRNWYVGVRVKRLFSRGDRDSRERYYFDNRVLSGSDVVPPEVR